MELINGIPNWIRIFKEDSVPPIEKWDLDELQYVLEEAIFQINRCDKYTLVYRAEVLLRREGPTACDQESLIIDVECPRNGEDLQWAGNMELLGHLPVETFSIYRLEKLVTWNIWDS